MENTLSKVKTPASIDETRLKKENSFKLKIKCKTYMYPSNSLSLMLC